MDAPSEINDQNNMDDAATNAVGAGGGGDRENLEGAIGSSAEESQARVNGQEEEENEEEGEEDAADEEKEEESEQSEDEEEEVEEEGGASDEENDYEAQRQRNIERNQAMLRQLGLLVDPLAMAAPFGTSPSSTSTSTTASSTSSSSPSSSSALLPLSDAAPVAAGFSLQTPKRKYKPRQKRNVDTPTRTSSRLQTKVIAQHSLPRLARMWHLELSVASRMPNLVLCVCVCVCARARARCTVEAIVCRELVLQDPPARGTGSGLTSTPSHDTCTHAHGTRRAHGPIGYTDTGRGEEGEEEGATGAGEGGRGGSRGRGDRGAEERAQLQQVGRVPPLRLRPWHHLPPVQVCAFHSSSSGARQGMP